MRNVELAHRALANNVRREILTRLHQAPRTVTELATFFKISRPAISRHLKVLLEGGLVRVHKSGRFNHYVIDEDALQSAVTLLCHPPRAVELPPGGVKMVPEQPGQGANRTHVRAPNCTECEKPSPRRRRAIRPNEEARQGPARRIPDPFYSLM